jgi:hypothetical protein
VNEKQIQHLIDAIAHQQRALGILYNGAKLSPQASQEFATAYARAGNAIAQARAAGDGLQEAEATLGLR